MHLLTNIEGLAPSLRLGTATASLVDARGERIQVAEASYWWGPTVYDGPGTEPVDSNADWALDFEIPSVHQDYLGQRIALRLVAATIAHYSAGRTCLVGIVAEPRGWQSLKVDRREPQTRALVEHWSRIGFGGGFGFAPGGLRVHQVVRDYRVPDELAQWQDLVQPGSGVPRTSSVR
jgi:hypothetical protein